MAKQISVPRTPASAYNPKRKVSDLLKAHIANLEAVTRYGTAAASKRKPKNEAQASAYIAEMTRQLHPALYASAAPPPPASAEAPSPAVLSLPTPARRRRRTVRKKKTPARPKPTRAWRQTGTKTGKARKRRKAKRAVRRSSRY